MPLSGFFCSEGMREESCLDFLPRFDYYYGYFKVSNKDCAFKFTLSVILLPFTHYSNRRGLERDEMDFPLPRFSARLDDSWSLHESK